MDQDINLITQGVLVALSSFLLAVVAMLIYVLYALVQLHREVRRLLKGPEVERDSEGND